MLWILIGSGCSALQKHLGAPDYTPELKAAEEECTVLANEAADKREKERGKKFIFLQRGEVKRVLFQECMQRKGYDSLGRKKKGFRVDHRDTDRLEPPRGWKHYEEKVPPIGQSK